MSKWYKLVGIVVVVVLGIVAFAGIALAQGPEGNVDTDGDGVCDVCGEELGEGLMRGRRFNQDGEREFGKGPNGDFVDEDGDGVCDDFVDEDGDGVCDVCGEELGEGLMRGRGSNGDFVDEDGDGVCDDRDGSGSYAGRGQMGGQMSGRMGGRSSRR